MKRTASVVLVAALALGSLAGCPAGPSSSGASGEVIDRERSKASAKSWREYNYAITVREDGGKTDTGRVSRAVYESCQVGDRWPDCKK